MIRLANTEDVHFYFDWANDQDVRNNSLNPEPILFPNHKEWFLNKLQSTTSVLLVFEIDTKPIGQIRFDKEDAGWFIDYSIQKDFRGNGYGFKIIQAGIDYLRENFEDVIVEAWVKPENIASARTFEKANFTKEGIITKNNIELLRYVFQPND